MTSLKSAASTPAAASMRATSLQNLGYADHACGRDDSGFASCCQWVGASVWLTNWSTSKFKAARSMSKRLSVNALCRTTPCPQATTRTRSPSLRGQLPFARAFSCCISAWRNPFYRNLSIPRAFGHNIRFRLAGVVPVLVEVTARILVTASGRSPAALRDPQCRLLY
jgi:hypothetical protein